MHGIWWPSCEHLQRKVNTMDANILCQLLEYKKEIIDLLKLFVEKTKNERGYSLTCRLITRIIHTLAGFYPLDNRFVNPDEFEDPGTDLTIVNYITLILSPSI